MSEQRENLERVSDKIAASVRAFVLDAATLHPPRFIGPDLARYVERRHDRIAAESALRVMRDLRGPELGVEVACVDRAGSVYEVRPLSSPLDSGPIRRAGGVTRVDPQIGSGPASDSPAPVPDPSPSVVGAGAGGTGLGTATGNGAGVGVKGPVVVDPRQDGDGGACDDQLGIWDGWR